MSSSGALGMLYEILSLKGCEFMQFNIVPIATFFIGLLAGFLLSYMKEKGKNLATKEDITDITNKIEGTKSEYIKDIEELKADLQLYIGQQSKREVIYKEVSLIIFEIVNSLYDINLYRSLEYETGMDLGTRQMVRNLDNDLTNQFTKLKKIVYENNIYIESDLLNEIINLIQDFEKNSVNYNSTLANEGRVSLRTDLNLEYFKENILPNLIDIINKIRSNIEMGEYNGDFFDNIMFFDL